MINLVIIDDEPAAIEVLSNICTNSGIAVTILGSASTIDEGVLLIHKHKPQLVFLDIEFPEGTGFDLLEQVADFPFQLVFTTAHEHYALRAIKHHALDYILKPIHEIEVKKALEQAILQTKSEVFPRWNRLIELLQRGQNNKLMLPIKDGYRYVSIDHMVYLKANGSYTHVFLQDGNSLLISKKLSWFERQLNNRSFLRVQRSYLVHRDHILELHRNDGGYLITSTNASIPISKSFRTETKDIYDTI